MFKIARTVTQIYNAASNIPMAAFNSIVKCCSQSKVYAEDASQESKEYVDAVVATYSIADEFNAFREHGYDFVGAWKAIENQNINKTLSERMKELVVSGHISRYGGESGLKEAVEELRDKHVLVLKEFMLFITGDEYEKSRNTGS